MTRFAIQGQQTAADTPADLRQFDREISAIEPIASFALGATRDEGDEHEIEVLDGAVVEITLADDSVIYMRADELGDDIASRVGLTREGGAVPISDAYWGGGEETRGLKDLALKAVGFFNVKSLIEPAAEASAYLTAKWIAEKIEGKLQYDNRVSRVSTVDGALGLTPVKASDIPTDRPVLLFLHGTASTTDGSFGALWRGEHGVMEALVRVYGAAVFAFEHDTLSRSPIENAAELAGALPRGAVLHIVSHSRGGQIGELMCRANRLDPDSHRPVAAFDQLDFELFSAERDLHSLAVDEQFRKDQLEHLKRLSKAIADRKVTVERFVRVACPVGGTSLLSQRLDRWVNLLLNAAGLAGLDQSPTYAFLKTFLVTLVAERRDAQDFPGLESMTPESALARMLNRPDVTVASDLSVVSGDLKAGGLGSFLKTLATDWLYGGDHDLVVNTVSMRGGAQRPLRASREYFRSGKDVNHFSYFGNKDSAFAVRRALLDELDSLDDFIFLKPGITERIRGMQAPHFTGNRPILFFLPGIMGSHLAVNDDRIWVDLWDLVRGGLRKLNIDNNASITPDGVHEESYAELIEFLSRTHDVHVFAFDWRLPIVEEAQRLAGEVEQVASQSDQPVRFLAHSMGGLVVRCMQSLNQNGVWDRVSSRHGHRFLMLGTPNGGSHTIVRVLIGFENILKALAGIDLRNSKRKVLRIVSRFRGLLHLLPVPDSEGNDYFDAQVWNRLDEITRLNWEKPRAADIASVAPYRRVLEAAPTKEAIYVAGKADETVVAIRFGDPTSRRPLRFFATEAGDGRVPWSTGIPADSSTWYTMAKHGELAAYRPAFEAYRQLLETGNTSEAALTRDPPATARRDGALFEVTEEAPERTPTARDFNASVFDLRPLRVEIEESQRIRVGIVHADLAFANAPVVVGHYRDDAIVSAEAVIDRRLGGRLSTLVSLDDYPNEVGEAEVFLTRDDFPGAIVVGLGRFGDLRAGALATAYRTAVLRLVRTRDNVCDSDQLHSFRLATLLIGSSEGGVSIEDSLAAVVQGVQQANALLRRAGEPNVVDRIEVIELWQDRALDAAHALRRLARDSAQRDIEDVGLSARKGGRRRIRFGGSKHWWRRLQVTADDEHRLSFRAITDRSRIDVRHVPGQLKAIEDYIESAATFARAHEQKVGKTLFEYLVPHAYKPFGLNAENLILSIDEATARIPWELLVDRESQKIAKSVGKPAKPLSVTSGMIRQLLIREPEELREVATKNTALIISDPANSGLPALTGAQEEGKFVRQQLIDGGFKEDQVTYVPTASKADILEALVADDYRIVHLAGHGQVKTDNGVTEAGLVIEGGQLLTGGRIACMRMAPEMAFINCCHLGRFASDSGKRTAVNDYRQIAASLSRTFISMGAKVVVATGWAVSDSGAKIFAEVFYRRMLGGEKFGRAVQLARSEIFTGGGDNTWGAYQCYGHPDYRLTKHQRSISAESSGRAFIAIDEAIARCSALATDAGNLGDNDGGKIREELAQIVPQLSRDWFEEGGLPAALGHAYAELGDYDPAISYYELALKAERGSPIKAVEQLANLKARRAVEIKDKDPELAEQMIAEAIRQLDNLLVVTGATSERLSLLASAHKRRSLMCQDDKSRLHELGQAADYYEQAVPMARNKPGEDVAYPQNQSLVCRIAWHRSGGKPITSDIKQKSIDAIDQLLAESPDSPKNFWQAVQPADLMLSRGLWSNTLVSDVDKIKAAYVRAFNQSSSNRERGSVRETLDFLLFHLSRWVERKPGSRAAKFLVALENIRAAVKQPKVAPK